MMLLHNPFHLKQIGIFALFSLALFTGYVQADSYRQIVIQEHGAAELMQVVEHPTLPEPGPGEVRIKVLTASASFTDTMVRKGLYQGISAELPYGPGYDLIGIIDKPGTDVTGFALGQRVADLTIWGAYTEFAIRPTQYLIPVPDDVDPVATVSLILTYTTVYQMLHRVAGIKKGQTALIHGASGAVGTALAHLGDIAGLTMYGTASTAKQVDRTVMNNKIIRFIIG